jgi:hypothetical protein
LRLTRGKDMMNGMLTNDFTADYISMTGEYPKTGTDRLLARITTGNTQPDSPKIGDVWFGDRLYIYDGKVWRRPGGEEWTS